MNPPVFFKYIAIPVEFDGSIGEEFPVDALPEEWKTSPPGPSSQAVGDRWVRENRPAVLAVPSTILSGEPNYLLNPAHRDFKQIAVGRPEPFTFDPRLLA